MKKLLVSILLLLLVFALAAPAQALAAREAPPEFFTWAALGTYAGAMAATIIFTQLLKGVGFVERIPTRIFSYVVAFIVLLAAAYFTGALTLETAALCLINAAVVSLASNGAYDVAKSVKKTE